MKVGPVAGRFAIIIPARLGSTRYPGKPLVGLRGSTGISKPLIRRSWEAAASICDPAMVWVATDDERIAETVEDFGGRVAITSSDCRNGTERCAEALAQIGDVPEFIVNLQGDAPLTPTHLIAPLLSILAEQPSAAMATAALRCSDTMYKHLVADAAVGRVGGTTVVLDQSGRALYFSKRILPYIPQGADRASGSVHLHLGLYAYRRNALLAYAAGQPSQYELLEGLEQLRFLDQGEEVRVHAAEPVGWDCIELNNPSDVPAIEAALRQRGIE